MEITKRVKFCLSISSRKEVEVKVEKKVEEVNWRKRRKWRKRWIRLNKDEQVEFCYLN